MLVIGAKGFAKEVLEICQQNVTTKNISFYDDINHVIGDLLFGQFPILHSFDEAKMYFENYDKRFTLGIGNPKLRKELAEKFRSIGGILTSTISNSVEIGNFQVEISNGVNILGGVKISNNVQIGEGSLIYYNAILTHDVVIGNYVEISPGVILLGRSKIKDNCQIGAGAIVLPDVIISENTVIGAGAVVTKNVPKNSVVVGIPGKWK